MGVEAVSSLSNRSDATASHGDVWSCLGPAGKTISVASISLGLFLDGSATLGPSNDAHLEASNSIGAGEGFKFVFDQADGGFSASADYFLPGGTTTTGMPSSCSSTPDHPCPFSTGDLQDFNAFTNGGSVAALHTFGDTIYLARSHDSN